jgi:uncharacterized protein YerC/predicted transcriptional regulator
MARTESTETEHKLYLTKEEVAERLGVTAQTVNLWAKAGVLRRRGFGAGRIGQKGVRFRQEDVERLRKRREHVTDDEDLLHSRVLRALEAGSQERNEARQASAGVFPKLRKAYLSLKVVERMAERRRKGATWRESAAEAGMKEKLAQYYVRRMFPGLQGERAATREMAEKALAMRREGASYSAIGKELGFEPDTISRAFRVLTVPWQRGQREGGKNSGRAKQLAKLIREAAGVAYCEFKFDVDRAVALRRKGWDYISISKAVGVSRPTVMNAIKLRMLVEPGQRNKKAKEPRADSRRPGWPVDKAIEMLRNGEPVAKVAETMGIKRARLRRGLKRRGLVIDGRRGVHFDWLAAKKMLEEGKSLQEVSEAVGACAGTIYKYGLARGRRRGSHSRIDWLAVKKMREEGKSIREVAEAIGASYWAVRDCEKRERKREQQGPPKQPEQPVPLHVPTMLRMHNMLATPEEIGAALHRQPSEIETKLRELGCLLPGHPVMTRTGPDLEKATEMLKAGAKIKDIALACRMTENKVRVHLRTLLDGGVIARDPKLSERQRLRVVGRWVRGEPES